MATFYWVGGSGTWNATDTTNWASSSGGAGGAGVPTSTDNVIFDSLSNATAYTVTLGTNAVCEDLTAAGPLAGNVTFSLGATAVINCHGSMTLPATGLTWTGTAGANLVFRATVTGKTVTTNGVSLTNTAITFDGVGGGWTLGSAFTHTGNTFFVTNGSFDTGNFNLTTPNFFSTNSNIRSIALGSSTVNISGTTAVNFSITTNLTFNAGTSSIVCAGAASTLNGGGLTFYNVSFTSAAAGTTTINGANTFNNVTQTSRNADGVRQMVLSDNQIVNGTLTLGAANTAVRRIQIFSNISGAQRTITLNGTLATLSDVSFKDINAAGTVSTPWTGTRIGNGLGNSNITFDAPKTVYWNLAGSQNWSAVGWATTNNGIPAVNNFPLPQDAAVFTEAGSAGTVTINGAWWIGNLQMADGVSNRTTAFTLATGTNTIAFFGNVTLFSNLTLTGTGSLTLSGQGITQTITSAAVTFTQLLTVDCPASTVQLQDNLTMDSARTFTLTAGTLDLSSGNRTLSTGLFSSSNSNTRAILFGTGNITLTGNAATIWNFVTATGFTYTGTPTVNSTYVGSVGTRNIFHGSTAGATETNTPSFYVSAGAGVIDVSNAKTLDTTGFSGSLASRARTIYENLIFASGMTTASGTTITTFGATSGTQLVTFNGVTIDFQLTVNGVGGIVAFQDALTMAASRILTIINGTLQLKNGVTSTVGSFVTSNTNQKFLQSTTLGSQATLSQASGTVDVTCLTIRDINATGGATWNAFTNQLNIDAGNNDGWDFGISPVVGGAEYTYALRSFTQPRRF